MHAAAEKNRLNVAELLINYGADINAFKVSSLLLPMLHVLIHQYN